VHPFSLPAQRILIKAGQQGVAETPLSAHAAGLALSGSICGTLLLVIGERWRHVAKNKRGELTNPDL
jgi:hypothetical protein